MNNKNGGPAFPIHDPSWLQPETVDEGKRIASGMTMRDYFAAKAMQSFFSKNEVYHLSNWNFEAIAKYAYVAADAMLAEREKTND